MTSPRRFEFAAPILATVFTSLMGLVDAQATTMYRIEALPQTAPHDQMLPWVINDHGHAFGGIYTGFNSDTTDHRAWKWDGVQLTRFKGPTDQHHWFMDVNTQGLVVGQTTPVNGGNGQGIAIASNGDAVLFGNQVNVIHSVTGVNDTGTLVGIQTLQPVTRPPFNPNFMPYRGTIDGLSPLPIGEARYGWVGGINNTGDAVGVLFYEDDTKKLVVWNADGGIESLSEAGDFGPTWGWNENGIAVGGLQVELDGQFVYTPIFWDGQNITTMDMPSDIQAARAWSLNDAHTAVGHIFVNGYQEAALWEADGTYHDTMDLIVNPAGWDSLTDARDINNAGQIIGSGIYNGEERAYILTAIPEPMTAALMMLGGILLLNRRHGRS